MAQNADIQAAVNLLNAGRYGEALRIGKAVLKAWPKSPKALEFCGVCAVHLGDMSAAQKYFSRLVKILPNEATHWANLGYACFTAGELKPAERAYRHAAKHQPGNPDHFMNVALCRGGRGDLEGAAEWFSKAATIAPDHPRALQGLANVRLQQGRPFEAMPALRRLSEAEGLHDPAFWVDYGEAAMRTLDVPETRRAIQNATRAMAAEAGLEARIANLWKNIGELAEARVAMDRALALRPDDPHIQCQAAILHMDAGEFDAAARCYESIVERHPEVAEPYFGLSQLRRFRRDSEDDKALLAAMEKGLSLQLDDPARLHFALGKAYDDTEDVDRAFAHLSTANELRRKERPFVIDSDVARVARLKRRFPAGGVAYESAEIPADTVSPIFIVGMPRSGTTLVEQIVGAHPDVTACGELLLMPSLLASLFREEEADLSPQAWKEIGALYRDRVAGLAAGRPRITDKLPGNYFNVGAIWSALPDARVILLQRNPYDVGLSCFQASFTDGLDFTFDLGTIGRMHRLCTELCDHWMAVAPKRILSVQYESLVREPDVESRRILAYCGLEWHPDCARFYNQRRRIGTASFNQANQPVYTSSVERWRGYEAYLGPLFEALAE